MFQFSSLIYVVVFENLYFENSLKIKNCKLKINLGTELIFSKKLQTEFLFFYHNKSFKYVSLRYFLLTVYLGSELKVYRYLFGF